MTQPYHFPHKNGKMTYWSVSMPITGQNLLGQLHNVKKYNIYCDDAVHCVCPGGVKVAFEEEQRFLSPRSRDAKGGQTDGESTTGFFLLKETLEGWSGCLR